MVKCEQCCSPSTYPFPLDFLIIWVLEQVALGALNQGGQAEGVEAALAFSVCLGDVTLIYGEL